MSGDTCTGYTIGKRRIMARIYNKTTEATLRHDDEYFALIKEHAGDAFDPTLDIWRVEFELKRAGGEGFCLVGKQEDDEEQTEAEQALAEMEGEDLPAIGTLKRALCWSPALWKYLTTRWLRLVEPTEDTNRARWVVHPIWKQIQESFTQPTSTPLSEAQCCLVREQRRALMPPFAEKGG